MSYCEVCKDLDPGSELLRYVDVDVSFNALESSAGRETCNSCCLLFDAITHFVDPNSGKGVEAVRLTLLGSLAAQLRFGDGGFSGLFYLHVLLGKPSPWASIHEMPRISGDTSSDESFSWSAEQFRNCVRCHQACPSPVDTPLPTRVLGLGLLEEGGCGNPIVKLYETHNEIAQYVCLSHCWGKAPVTHTTTTSTLRQYQDHIDWSALPRTFQHTISFTQKLRIRYLWIDSLCIIQDDKEDWRKESAMMCSVFRGSALTLCATASSDSRGGLFFKASPDERGYSIWNRQAGEAEWQIYVRRPIQHFSIFEGEKNSKGASPLLKRAWVFQERLLAPRLVHFGPQELIWECADETSCECSGIEVTQPKETYAWGLQKGSAEHIRDMWHGLVASYTGLQLTFGHDRLPALAGLAKQFLDYKRGKYLAGLWEDTLVEDLLWHIDFPSARPEEWQAPTCIGISGHATGLDSFGELSSATITLAGLIARVGHHGDSFENSFESEIHQFFVVKSGCERSIRVDADYFWYRDGLSKVSDAIVYLFKLAKDQCYLYSLILRRVDSPFQAYERIGIVRQDLADLAGDADSSVFDRPQEDTLVNIV
ncbi:MAG: hypothetical protein M1839_004760 [Geoglossum umbratile]|nr:MAG: hypothetical protein M1839_004760 [Geoglossum umbratile]